MKKNTMKDQERKSHRLSLKRETIRFLKAPELLELARGGVGTGLSILETGCGPATSASGGGAC